MKLEEASIETIQELNRDGIFIEVNDGKITAIVGETDYGTDVLWRIERDGR